MVSNAPHLAWKGWWMAALIALGLLLISAGAQAPAPPSESSAKYHAALLKRPSGGYLFDRFYSAWLESGTPESLRAFLESRASPPGAQSADRLLLAYYFVRQTQDSEALRVFGEALAADPANAEAWLELAKLHARLLDFPAAVNSLDRALAANPKAELAAEIGQLRGRMLVRAGKVDEGLKAWEAILAAQPDDLDLHEDLVELLLSEGLVDQALASCQKLVEKTKDPYQQVVRRMQLGDIYQRAGRRQEAIDTYSANLAASGNDSWVEKEVLRQLGQLYRREDDLSGWRKHLEQLIATHPQRIALQERLAALAAEMNDADAAIAAYAKILKLTPGDRTRREAYIGLLSQLKKPKEAADQMRELVALYPEDAGLLAQLATLQHEAKDTAAARASVLAYLEKSAKAEYDYLRAGRLLEEFEDAGAGEIYGKLLAAFPDSIAARETQAAYLHRTGQKEAAIALWKNIAEKGNAQDVIRAAQFLASRGEKPAAYEILQARVDEFQADFVYLGQICAAAVDTQNFQDAVPWVEKRLRLAASPNDLQDVIRQASGILSRIDDPAAYRENLRGKADRSVAESCLLAEMLEQAGDFQAAEDALRPSLDQGNALGMSQLVRILESRGFPDQAAETMTRLIAQPGERTSSNLQRLVSLRRRALQTDAALRAVEEWRQLAPASSMPWREEASILLETGRAQEAIAVLQRAVQRFEGQTDVLIALANACADEGKTADATRLYWSLYEESEDLAGKLSWVRNLARLAQQSGQTDALVEQFQERRRTNRESIEPLLALAEIHRQARNFEEHRKALLEATRMRPDDVSLVHEIARSEEEEGDWMKSLETLKGALALDRTDSTRRRIARLQLLWGDQEEGLRLLMELSGGPDAGAVAAMADALILNGGWEKVASFLAPQIERFPEDFRLVYLRAIALEESGQIEAARDEFLRLLEWPHELPATANAGTAPARSPNLTYGEFPPQTFELATLQSGIRTAYAYHQQLSYLRQTRRAASSSGGNTAIVILPTALRYLRAYALAHLRGLASQMKEEQVEDLVVQLRHRGVDHAEDLTLLRFSRTTESNLPEDPITDAILAKHPDNAYLQAIGVTSSWSHPSPASFPIERMRQAYRALEKDYPNLAMVAAITASLSGHDQAPEGEKLLDLALRDGRALAKPSTFLRQVVNNAVGPDKSLDPRYRGTFLDLAMKWHAEPQGTSSTAASRFDMFNLLTSVLAAEEDPTRFLNFAQTEIRDFRANPKLATQAMARISSMMPSGRGQSSIVASLAMPPVELPNVPPNIILSFRHNLPRLSGMDDFANPERLAGKLDLVTDPSFKFIIAALAKRQDVADAILAQWMTPEARTQPMVGEYMLVAAYRGQRNDFAGAVEALEFARQWPMPKALRQRLDSAIASYAVGAGNSAPEVTKTAGQQALLRLRFSAKSYQDREILIRGMQDLGLAKEAELLAAQNAKASSPSRTGALNNLFSSRGTMQNDRQQITSLFNAGDKDKALPLMISQLRRAAQAMTAPGAAAPQVDYNIRSLVAITARNVSEAEIMAQLGEPKTRAEKLEQAAILELLGQREKAIPLYEANVEAGKLHDGLRLRLAALKAVTDPEAGAAALAQLDPGAVSNLEPYVKSVLEGGRYLPQIQSNLNYSLAGAVTLWLERMDAATAARVSAPWIKSIVLHNLQINGPSGTHQLGMLFIRDQTPLNAEAWRQRLEIHQRLCRSMISVPRLARRGFMDYATLAVPMAKLSPENWAELDLLAVQALEARQLEATPMTRMIGQDFMGRYYPEWTPEEYFIWRAWQKSGAEGIGEAQLILAATMNWAPRDIRTSTQAFYDLWFGEAANFFSAAKIYDEIYLFQPTYASDFRVAARADLIYEAWQARRDTVGDVADFREFTLAQARKPQQGQVFWLADHCLGELAATGDRAGIGSFLEELTLIRLGPKEGWDRFVPQPGNNITIIGGQQVMLSSSGYQDVAHREFAGFLTRGVRKEATVYPVLDFIQREGLNDKSYFSSQSLPMNVLYDSTPDLAILAGLLKNGPLREGMGLPAVTLVEGKPLSLLRSLLEKLKATGEEGEETRAGLLTELQPRKDLPAALAIAYLSSEQPAAEIFALLGTRRTEIEAFQPEDWEGLNLFLEPMLPGWRDAELSPESREILQKIADLREQQRSK